MQLLAVVLTMVVLTMVGAALTAGGSDKGYSWQAGSRTISATVQAAVQSALLHGCGP